MIERYGIEKERAMINDFLLHQAKALTNVHDRATLEAWHKGYANAWCPKASRLAASANATLRLNGDFAIRDELGYLATESAASHRAEQTWILLSVNPSWEEKPNALERGLKGQPKCDGQADLGEYRRYRSQYFPRWYNETKRDTGGGGNWWNNALNFLHDCAGLPRGAGMMGRDPRLDVIGWELWPMHSPSDGLTRNIGINAPLRHFAEASIWAALRTLQNERRPGGLVLASTVGFELLPRLNIPGLVPGVHGDVGGIEVRRYQYMDRTVSTIRCQMFAAWLTAETKQALAEWVRAGGAQQPPGQVIAPAQHAAQARAQAAPQAARAAVRAGPQRLDDFVTAILGPCICRLPGAEACPAGWHAFPRQGRGERARVGGPTLVKVHIPKRAGLPVSFTQSAEAEGLAPMQNGETREFKSYNVNLNVNNPVHRAFLEYWLPRTIA